MLDYIRRLLAPPVFEDEDQTRIARLLHWVLLSVAALNVFDMVILAVFAPETLPTFWTNGLLLAVTGVSYGMMRQGRVRAAGIALCLAFWMLLAYYLSVSGGVTSPALGILSVVIITSAVLLGTSGAVAFGLLCIVTEFVLYWAGTNGWLTLVEGPPTPARLFATHTAILLGIAVLMGLSERNVLDSLKRAWKGERALAEYNGQLLREIAERKRIEEAYRVLVEHSAQGLVIFQDNRIVFVNPRMRTMLGYSADELMALENPIAALSHPDDQQILFEIVQRALTGSPELAGMEFRVIHKQGHELWLEAFSAAITYQGKPALQAATVDITERKQAESAQRQSEDEFRQLSDSSLEGIAITDQGRIILANKRVAEMLGHEPSDLLGKQVLDFVAPSSRALVLEHIQTGYDNPYDHLALRKDGSVFPVEVSGQAMTYRGRPMRVTALRDITERKLAEEALRHSEERFSQAFHSSPIPITLSTLDEGQFIDVNESCLRALGYQREEMIGHTVGELQTWVDSNERDDVLAMLQQQGAARQCEVRFRTKNGDTRDALASFEVIETQGERYLLGSWLDITELKLAEKQALELALTRERAENLRDFLGTISHDLKTPLSVINSSLYLLERIADPAKQQDKINAIKSQTLLLEKYIQDILTMFRLDHGPQLARKPVDVGRLLIGIEQRLRPAADQKNLTMTLELNQGTLAVLGDENELERVLVNLIENAVHYTPDSGSITVRTAMEGSSVITEISDTGIGIKEADLALVFDRFYRASEAREMAKQGTGLGLAIVKKIVELHDGTVEVESIVGQGTTFRVRLPLVAYHRN